MQIKKVSVSLFVAGLVAAAPGAYGQQSATGAPRLVFDVATIRPSGDMSAHESMNVLPGGRFEATLSVRSLIERAYDIRDFQLARGSKWLDDKYEIVAKSDETADPSNLKPEEEDQLFEREGQRLQALLADRFQLKFHRTTKELAVYALVVAKGGPKLNAPNPSERHRLYTQRAGRLACYSASMAEFADELNEIVEGRLVVDRTGLTGKYDFSLRWTPDALLEARAGAGDASGPSLFTALEEQLGLKLKPAKAPVEVLVIDRVERPSGGGELKSVTSAAGAHSLILFFAARR